MNFISGLIMKEKFTIAFTVIICLLLGGLFGSFFFPKTVTKTVTRNIISRDTLPPVIDTLVKYVSLPPIKIIEHGDIIYVRDTIIETQPFVAVLDTVVKRDTLNLEYYFPENLFKIDLRFKPEETKIITKYVTINTNTEIEKPEPWYIKAAYGAGGVLLGYGLGYLSR